MPEPVRDNRGSTPEAHAGRVGPACGLQAEPSSRTKHQAEIDPVRQTKVGRESQHVP